LSVFSLIEVIAAREAYSLGVSPEVRRTVFGTVLIGDPIADPRRKIPRYYARVKVGDMWLSDILRERGFVREYGVKMKSP